jgi:excisionase family DNA binding protein
MEVMDYIGLLERLESEMPLWRLEKCSKVLGILERLRASAWARILGGGLSEKTASQQEGGKLLTLPQVAERLAVPETYAYELARQNRLPVVRLGKYVRVPAEEFDRWVAQQASLERPIDREPYPFHSAPGRSRPVSGSRGSKKNGRAASKSQSKISVGFRPPVSIPGLTEPGEGKREPSEKEG